MWVTELICVCCRRECPSEGEVEGWWQVGTGKRNSTLAIQSVTLGVSLLDKNIPGYPDPKSFAYCVLRALLVSRTEHCSCIDGLWPRLPKLLGVFGSLC